MPAARARGSERIEEEEEPLQPIIRPRFSRTRNG
jgi:hypothetical protein